MNLSLFISKRINKVGQGTFSAVIHRVAVATIAMGLGLILISFLILTGFRENIIRKVVSFSGHCQVLRYSLSNSYEEDPISVHNPVMEQWKDISGIEGVYPYSSKPGLLKDNDEVAGIILKGVDQSYEHSEFATNIIAGHFPQFDSTRRYDQQVMVSKTTANLLDLHVGDTTRMYFIQDPPRFRKVYVSGVYESGLEEFDEKVVIGDLRMIQRLNQWPDSLVGGLEVHLKSMEQLDQIHEQLFDLAGFDLFVTKVTDRHADFFDWLKLLDNNVVIILSLILFVACINMVSVVLILIMERTQMIGMLKALGATDHQVRKIFMYNGSLLILKGMLYGNLIGLGFGWLQWKFHLIPLEMSSYYMNYVPISWDWTYLIGSNLLTFVVVTLVLWLPTVVASKITPIKAIRFD
ncbi:ABC transporter permease [Persicobacter psychrovividus]|uniref:Permease n=1 Tax=Persicobacter psychrovividus TaxID=387638 RepID=A0ABN6LE68_9BACT|nr:permease [Persicobacter psychrovividus]